MRDATLVNQSIWHTRESCENPLVKNDHASPTGCKTQHFVAASAGEDAIRHLFSRSTHREFGYAAIAVMLVFYFVGAAWTGEAFGGYVAGAAEIVGLHCSLRCRPCFACTPCYLSELHLIQM
jgi:hypothetical protein